MPFTISHTAAVLPFGKLLRRWKLLSAAVIGSMVPDFGIFLPEVWPRYETHGIVPLFDFCLPIGLLTYWVFQLHVKPATLQLMPTRLFELWREDGQAAPLFSVRQWTLAAIGVLLGAVTHLIWDGFTHENARGVRLLPMLDGLELHIGSHSLTWYRVLQHSSSVIGLAFVLWFVGRAFWAQPDHLGDEPRMLDRAQRHRWFYLYVGAAALASLIIFIAVRPHLRGLFALTQQLASAAVSSMWGIMISLLVVSAFLRHKLHTLGRSS